MAYEQKVNSGSLFRNKKKTKDSPKEHPDHTGSINVAGIEYWLDAWINEVKSGPNAGSKYFRLRVKPKEQPAPPQQTDPMDEGAPF